MIWLVAIISLSFVALTMPFTIRLAHWSGAIDAPNSDVVTHTDATPLLGGLTVLVAVLVIGATGVFAVPIQALVAIAALSAIGLYKDITRVDLSPLFQMVMQIGCCTLILQSSAAVDSQPWWVFVMGVVVGVALINAVNFLDVSDGLCAAVAIVICLGLFAAARAELSLYLAAALVGFFAWNKPKARVFMGDVGSFCVGSVLYFLAVHSFAESQRWARVALILAIPFTELAITILVRLARARAVTRGDASHVSLLLLNLGWSPWAVIGAFVTAQVIAITMALAVS